MQVKGSKFIMIVTIGVFRGEDRVKDDLWI